MIRYQLWDIPSSTLLLETTELTTIFEEVQGIVGEEGPAILDDFSMSATSDALTATRTFTGQEITIELQDQIARHLLRS